MMKPLFKPLLGLLFVFVLAFGIAACGDDEETESSSSGGASSGESTPSDSGSGAAEGKLIQSDPANKDIEITVGSKNFDEQFILGEIYAQAFEAAGYTVNKELNIGSEQVAFKTLKSGEISAYPEYTGTALTAFYKVRTADVPRDKAEAFSQMSEQLKGDKITAMPQTPFENTYRVASTKATAEKYGSPTTTSDLVKEAGNNVRLSGFPECEERADCYLGLNDTYNWKPKFVSSDGQYADLEADQADFTMGFSTDGPLSTDQYVTYEDDKSLFPPYNVSLLVRDDVATELGDAGVQLIEKIQEPLTEEVMQELNARVSVDKEDPEEVAGQYLSAAGFTGQ